METIRLQCHESEFPECNRERRHMCSFCLEVRYIGPDCEHIDPVPVFRCECERFVCQACAWGSAWARRCFVCATKSVEEDSARHDGTPLPWAIRLMPDGIYSIIHQPAGDNPNPQFVANAPIGKREDAATRDFVRICRDVELSGFLRAALSRLLGEFKPVTDRQTLACEWAREILDRSPSWELD